MKIVVKNQKNCILRKKNVYLMIKLVPNGLNVYLDRCHITRMTKKDVNERCKLMFEIKLYLIETP